MASRYPLERYPDFRADIIAGLSYLLDSRTGVRNSWSSKSIYEMARFIHIEAGRNPDSMRRDEVILYRDDTRSAPFMTNTATQSDFPGILGGALLNTASRLYDLAAPSLKRIALRRDRQNFQVGFATRLSRPVLAEIEQGGEIQTAALYERKETAQLKTFGGIISIGRMMLVSDAFNQAALTPLCTPEDSEVFEQLSANGMAGVTMADGQTLFHATHANTSTGVISATSLAAGVEALFVQKDANSAHFLATEPRYLVCGPKTAVTAKTELQKLAFNNNIEVIVEQRLSTTTAGSTTWYLAADPARASAIEFGSWAPQPRPQVQLAPAFQTDGLQFRILHYAGSWATDWRPIWRSTGV